MFDNNTIFYCSTVCIVYVIGQKIVFLKMRLFISYKPLNFLQDFFHPTSNGNQYLRDGLYDLFSQCMVQIFHKFYKKKQFPRYLSRPEKMGPFYSPFRCKNCFVLNLNEKKLLPIVVFIVQVGQWGARRSYESSTTPWVIIGDYILQRQITTNFPI